MRPTSTMRVNDVMSTEVVKAQVLDTAYDAVNHMLERDVGCIVAVDGDKVAGIITKGDVLRKAFLKAIDPKKVSVKKIMSAPVTIIDRDATLEEASRLMSEKHVSKLPVIEEGKLVGIITATDIIKAEPIQVGYLQELVRARFIPHERT